jgi:hypothetical protein
VIPQASSIRGWLQLPAKLDRNACRPAASLFLVVHLKPAWVWCQKHFGWFAHQKALPAAAALLNFQHKTVTAFTRGLHMCSIRVLN